MTDYKQTIGEYRVGVSFNPSGNPLIDEIKRKAADLIDMINQMVEWDEEEGKPEIPGPEWDAYMEEQRLGGVAMASIEEAAMWAVKAVTKRERE